MLLTYSQFLTENDLSGHGVVTTQPTTGKWELTLHFSDWLVIKLAIAMKNLNEDKRQDAKGRQKSLAKFIEVRPDNINLRPKPIRKNEKQTKNPWRF